MKHRETLLLLGALILIGAATFAALDGGPAEPPPGPDVVAPIAPTVDEPQSEPGQFREAVSGEPSVGRRVGADPNTPREPIGSAPGAGIVDGRLQLTASVAGKFSGYTIYVREMVGGDGLTGDREPFARSYPFKAQPNMSPLYFAIEDLPFSRHGYELSAFVPGFNGSTTRIACTPANWNPQALLWLSQGGAFALRLIDQQRNPLSGRDVVLRPIDWPPGRPVLQGTTDSFGTVVFERALGGDYDLLVGLRTVERLHITLPGVVVDGADVGVQSRIVTVPSGRTLRVEVFNAANFGLPEAELRLTQVDTQLLNRSESTTDYAGMHEFADVAPGAYQLDVRYPNHQPRSIRVDVPAEGDIVPQRVRMVPLR